MIKRVVLSLSLATLVLPAGFELTKTTQAAELSRAEIRSMPITARPSRPGHFYGNAVRRNHTRSQR